MTYEGKKKEKNDTLEQIEAHYEAAHSHSPSPLLILPFKTQGTMIFFFLPTAAY